MALSKTCDGSLEIPDFVVAAAARHGEYMAELTASFLRSIGFCHVIENGKTKPCGLSASTLLDLAAVLMLAIWKRTGTDQFLPNEIPSFDEAARIFQKRIDDGAAGIFHEDTPLHEAVFNVWFNELAWDGPFELQAEFAVGDVDEDALVDALAELVWTHRNDQAPTQSQPSVR